MKQLPRAENKRAHFDYAIDEMLETGIALTGPEVKAFRAGKASLNGTFVRPLSSGPNEQIELWLINAQFAGTEDPDRSRKLLAHRKEIDRFIGKVQEKGYTLLPIAMYFKRGTIKVELGLGKGKKQYEKRETIKKRDVERELRRGVK